MLIFVLRRVIQNLLMLAAIVLAVFVLMRLTAGDPARIKAPIFASEDILNQYRAQFGTDTPLLQQLGTFLSGLPRGDFGVSFRYQQPVFELIQQRLPRTVLLAVCSLLLAVTLALLIGVAGARKPYGWLDRFGLALSAVGQSAPTFWVGLMLVLVFSVQLGWFPAVGFQGPISLLLPTLAVALAVLPTDLRVIRTAMLDSLGQDYIRTAKAFGISDQKITYQYALRNAALPLITVIGIDLGYLLGGTIVTEVVFNYPGLGQLAIDAVNARDYPLVQAITIVTAAIFVFVNLVIDLIYMVLDPRIRISG
jgi:ABC-type dipeptide/oligopeptide/nickel transport system permease component